MLTEKRCVGPCGQIKSVDEFHWKSKRRGTRQARCKECNREYSHVHYLANSQEYKDRANSRLLALRTENHRIVKEWLSGHPCGKCGETNYKVLDTDLTSREINNLATPNLLAKLTESPILCRNCQASQD